MGQIRGIINPKSIFWVKYTPWGSFRIIYPVGYNFCGEDRKTRRTKKDGDIKELI